MVPPTLDMEPSILDRKIDSRAVDWRLVSQSGYCNRHDD